MKARASDQTFGALLISPAAAFIFCVAIYPILRVLWLSFFTQNLGTSLVPKFVGIDNYIRLVNDGHFLGTVRTTLFFTFVSVTTEFVFGLAFALLLNHEFRGRAVARAAMLVPWALPTTAKYAKSTQRAPRTNAAQSHEQHASAFFSAQDTRSMALHPETFPAAPRHQPRSATIGCEKTPSRASMGSNTEIGD